VTRRLVERCLDGDELAWGELVDRYQGLVYAVLRRARLRPEDQGDVFQNVWILLYRRLSAIRDPERIGGWLMTTTLREAMLARRSARGAVPIEREDGEQDLAIGSVRPVAEDELVRIERAQILKEEVAALPERCRAIVDEFLREGGTSDYDAMSARLGIPRGSIGPTRARCFARLRDRLVARGVL
jgi:RNA polymerase sigma factor (sigma-70 family)